MFTQERKVQHEDRDVEEAEQLLGGPTEKPWKADLGGSPARSRFVKALIVVVVIGALIYLQRLTFASLSEPAAFLSRWHAHELPDQLRLKDGSVPPKQTYENLAVHNPSLDQIVKRIEDLSVNDARLLQEMKQAAPALPDNVADHCGDIVNRQARNQQNTSAPRIVFYEIEKDLGLADRSKGMISSFLLAYALDLPFFIHWDADKMLPAETVFESPYINWAWPEPIATPRPDDPNTSLFVSFNKDANPQEDFYWTISTREALMDVAAPKAVNLWRGNIGHAAGQFRHPESWLGQTLAERGLTAESVYGCVFSYLFQPIKATRLAMADYQAVLSHPSVFSVAIQARLGDAALLAGDTHTAMDPQYPLHYFQCAMAAVQRLVKPEEHKLVVFYVVSDNPPFRNLAMQLSEDPERLRELLGWDLDLPPPLFLLGPSVPAHISVGSDMNPNNPAERPIMQHNMQYAIFENFLMDAADAHIITSNSGYGLVSALRTWTFGAKESTWMVHRPKAGQVNEPKLAVGDTNTGAWCKDETSKFDDMLVRRSSFSLPGSS